MRATIVALAMMLGAAAPLAAQMPAYPEAAEGQPRGGNPMFAGMSETGRAIMRAAMKSADARAGREATGAARDRWLAMLDADRFDPVALRRAMDDERAAANAAKMRQQTAMIAGFQQLSLADRRIFVGNARTLRARIAERTAGMRGGGMPPPP